MKPSCCGRDGERMAFARSQDGSSGGLAMPLLSSPPPMQDICRGAFFKGEKSENVLRWRYEEGKQSSYMCCICIQGPSKAKSGFLDPQEGLWGRGSFSRWPIEHQGLWAFSSLCLEGSLPPVPPPVNSYTFSHSYFICWFLRKTFPYPIHPASSKIRCPLNTVHSYSYFSFVILFMIFNYVLILNT